MTIIKMTATTTRVIVAEALARSANQGAVIAVTPMTTTTAVAVTSPPDVTARTVIVTGDLHPAKATTDRTATESKSLPLIIVVALTLQTPMTDIKDGMTNAVPAKSAKLLLKSILTSRKNR
jgi:hypothetical protein